MRRNTVICRLPSFSTAWPSTSTVPESGLSRPMTCFRSTLLPVPEPPMITSDSAGTTSTFTPSSTTLEPNDLWRSWTWILTASGIGSQNNNRVRKKSEIRIAMLATTTAAVVERPTPSAPPVV